MSPTKIWQNLASGTGNRAGNGAPKYISHSWKAYLPIVLLLGIVTLLAFGMRLASGADLPTGMINIDDLPTVAEQLGQLPLLDSNVIDVRLDNSQYDLGDAVKITVTSNTYPEFDM